MTKKKPAKGRKSNAGRKETITGEIEAKLEKLFRVDATDEQACIQAGCSTWAYYRKLKSDERFRKRMRAAQSYLHIKAKEAIAAAIKSKNPSHATWFLERREKDRYATKTVTEHEGSITTYADLEGKPKAKTPEEARSLAEQAAEEWKED